VPTSTQMMTRELSTSSAVSAALGFAARHKYLEQLAAFLVQCAVYITLSCTDHPTFEYAGWSSTSSTIRSVAPLAERRARSALTSTSHCNPLSDLALKAPTPPCLSPASRGAVCRQPGGRYKGRLWGQLLASYTTLSLSRIVDFPLLPFNTI
jgi:hypothetical protein